MESSSCHEQYPAWIVLIATLVPLLIWGTGAYILLQYGMIVVLVYLAAILVLEYRLLSRHCTDCWYYGKTCAFGKGRLAARFFPRGDPARFFGMTLTWKDVLPDFLIFMVPVLAGIALLLRAFSPAILGAVIALLVLGFAGNALVRGQLACRYCMQRSIGCPAEKLFSRPEP